MVPMVSSLERFHCTRLFTGVLVVEVPLNKTVYCGPNGVLIGEVPLYRTVYCGPNGVLIGEVPPSLISKGG